MNSAGTIYMNMYNLKRARGFDGKFPFSGLIILEDTLAKIVVIVNELMVCFELGVIDQGFSIVRNGAPSCNKRNIEELVLGKSKGAWSFLMILR